MGASLGGVVERIFFFFLESFIYGKLRDWILFYFIIIIFISFTTLAQYKT